MPLITFGILYLLLLNLVCFLNFVLLAQAETPQRDTLARSCRSLNLNLPPDYLDSEDQDQIIDINAKHIDARQSKLGSDMASESVKPFVYQFSSKEESTVNNCETSPSILREVSILVSYPKFLVVPLALTSYYPDFLIAYASKTPKPFIDVQTVSGLISDGNALEKSLLKELEQSLSSPLLKQ